MNSQNITHVIWKDSRSRLSFGFLAAVPVFVACDDIERALVRQKSKRCEVGRCLAWSLEVSVPVGTLEGARNFFLLPDFSIRKGIVR